MPTAGFAKPGFDNVLWSKEVEFMADEVKKTPALGTPEAPPAPPQTAGQFSVDSTALSTAYANFCRVTGTPEELVLDFRLNTQTTPQPPTPPTLPHPLSS